MFLSSRIVNIRTTIKKLTKEERIEEIAKLLSNEDISSAALATAKELMK